MNARYVSVLCSLPLLAAAAGAAAQSIDAPLRPMIQVQPNYPEAAVEQGIQGYVELDVQVGEQGRVEDVAIVASVPEGVFDAAARAAVMRWRYPPGPGRGTQSVPERIEFRVPIGPTVQELERAAAPSTVAAVGNASRNACVREESKFNYGDRVEVVLISTCDVPLTVAGCAAGTGQYRGRWACTTTEGSDTLLVAPDDARVGKSTVFDDGAATMTFADRFVVSRAPNSEYWWLACTLDDAACRDAASGWIRGLDGQLASADPQGRSSMTLARSY